MAEGPKRLAVHSGPFHADDALAIWLLRQLPEYRDAVIVRSRDAAVLAECDVVCDVGDLYDHAARRYDHHQSDYHFTFPGSRIPCASCGLVYFHFGKQIIEPLLRAEFPGATFDIDDLWSRLYERFVKEIDATDNGVDPAPGKAAYSMTTTIGMRISDVGPGWRSSDADLDEYFGRAVELIGKEFLFFLFHTYMVSAGLAKFPPSP
jgi:uncharacterized UPF0160 family protein